jgi:hypothetical protein
MSTAEQAAAFPSVVDAVRCAAEIQRGMIERELIDCALGLASTGSGGENFIQARHPSLKRRNISLLGIGKCGEGLGDIKSCNRSGSTWFSQEALVGVKCKW